MKKLPADKTTIWCAAVDPKDEGKVTIEIFTRAQNLQLPQTRGFGVDCAFIAANFAKATYIEKQSELCIIAKHN
ncbi:hypothetical protein D0T85_22410, partial [Bacteroides sp. 519]|nr:hypothetical protein [Bacteroides sp. 519]